MKVNIVPIFMYEVGVSWQNPCLLWTTNDK